MAELLGAAEGAGACWLLAEASGLLLARGVWMLVLGCGLGAKGPKLVVLVGIAVGEAVGLWALIGLGEKPFRWLGRWVLGWRWGCYWGLGLQWVLG